MESTDDFTYSNEKVSEIMTSFKDHLAGIIDCCPTLLEVKVEERVIENFLSYTAVVMGEDLYAGHKRPHSYNFVPFLLTTVLSGFLLEYASILQEKPAAQLPENLLQSRVAQPKVDRLPDSDDESLDIEMDTSLEHQSTSRIVSQQLSSPQHNITGKLTKS